VGALFAQESTLASLYPRRPHCSALAAPAQQLCRQPSIKLMGFICPVLIVLYLADRESMGRDFFTQVALPEKTWSNC
jgi:hypothetical protein